MSSWPADSTPVDDREARVAFEVEPPPPVKESPLVVVGAATGAAAALTMMFVYQLLRISWQLVHEVTRQGAAAPSGLESADRLIGVQVMGGLLSLAPTILAGGVLGALLGGFLSWSHRRQGILRSWLSGTLLTYVVALIVNLTVLGRQRSAALEYLEWRRLVGIPSLLFVLLFGGIGIYLHLRQVRSRADG